MLTDQEKSNARRMVAYIEATIEATRPGMSVNDWAAETENMSPSTVSRWRNGLMGLSLEKIDVVARGLNRPLVDVLFGVGLIRTTDILYGAGLIEEARAAAASPTTIAEAIGTSPELDDNERRVMLAALELVYTARRTGRGGRRRVPRSG